MQKFLSVRKYSMKVMNHMKVKEVRGQLAAVTYDLRI